MRFGILASGLLGFKTVSALLPKAMRPVFLYTDKASGMIIDFGRTEGIPLYIGKPNTKESLDFLRNFQTIDLIISINYIFLLQPEFISFSRFGCVNIHGSLLPKYRGRTPHVWAVINNETETGITVHYVDAGCDTGEIILQERFPIEKNFTGADILKEFEKRYPEIVLRTAGLFHGGTAPRGLIQDNSRATYFGKRTPDDGMIDWNWQKERINNWVRAQADPYPGAYSLYNGVRIVIDQIEFAETGYSWDMPNGYIVSVGEYPEVKTPNGVIRLVKLRSRINFRSGEILG